MTNYLFMVLLLLTALFLILIILIQRGKGGGLAGAFGGAGGQSAFGTKAGDLFTKITIGVAAFWIILCLLSIVFLQGQGSALGTSGGATTNQQSTNSDDSSTPASQPSNDKGDSAPKGDG